MLFTLIKRFIEAVLLVLCLFMSGMLGAAAEAASLDYNDARNWEQAYFCGAWLDEARGTLKINSKITAQAYPPVLDIFAPGVFHLYDYQFFYRNLQDNVKLRTSAYWR